MSKGRIKLITIYAAIFIVAILLLLAIKPTHNKHSTLQTTKLPNPQSTSLWPWHKSQPPWQTFTITHGDSLAKIFMLSEVHFSQIKAILKTPLAKQYLTELQIGHQLKLQINKQQQLLALQYQIDSDKTLYLKKMKNNWSSSIIHTPLQKTWVYQSGIIKSNFFNAAHDAKLPTNIATAFNYIFQGTINFAHDIHQGDHFELLYPQYKAHNKVIKQGHIAIAKLVVGSNSHTAIRFTYPKNHTSYYTPTGKGIQPLFLHRPLHYKRISSPFTWHRFDPIIHKWRPHLGIDFAATYGTPIHSIGDGRILFIGRDDGYGNAIKVRMGFKYRALYAHMSRFAKGLHRGDYVHKGQTIGYVGSTGWSTGPHLHFGFFVFGIPRNFLKYKMPNGNPVPRQYLLAFRKKAQAMQTKLSTKAATT